MLRQLAPRSSQAALIQIMRNLPVEWRDWGCISLMLRSGRVNARMNPADVIGVAISVAGMRCVIDNATPEASGAALGNVAPW